MRTVQGGFTLIEVAVALIVLELGLLGVVGLALHAQRLLADASVWSRAAVATGEIADSLAVSGARTGGTRSFPGGSISWTLGVAVGGGRGGKRLRRISIHATGLDGDELFMVRGIVPGDDPTGGP